MLALTVNGVVAETVYLHQYDANARGTEVDASSKAFIDVLCTHKGSQSLTKKLQDGRLTAPDDLVAGMRTLWRRVNPKLKLMFTGSRATRIGTLAPGASA